MIRENDSTGSSTVFAFLSHPQRLCYSEAGFTHKNLMATCPRCKGHLTDSHRCRRPRILVAVEIIGSALAGGFAGFVLVALFDPRGQITDLDSVSAVIGALVAVGINRALRSY